MFYEGEVIGLLSLNGFRDLSFLLLFSRASEAEILQRNVVCKKCFCDCSSTNHCHL